MTIEVGIIDPDQDKMIMTIDMKVSITYKMLFLNSNFIIKDKNKDLDTHRKTTIIDHQIPVKEDIVEDKWIEEAMVIDLRIRTLTLSQEDLWIVRDGIKVFATFVEVMVILLKTVLIKEKDHQEEMKMIDTKTKDKRLLTMMTVVLVV